MAEPLMHLQALPERERDARSEVRDLQATRQLEATVVAIILDFNQVRIQDSAGHTYALTRRTPGVNIDELREGQRVRCTVKQDSPLVLEAVACA